MVVMLKNYTIKLVGYSTYFALEEERQFRAHRESKSKKDLVMERRETNGFRNNASVSDEIFGVYNKLGSIGECYHQFQKY